MKFSAIAIALAAFFLSTDAIQNGVTWNVAPSTVRIIYGTPQVWAQAGGSIISHRHVLTSGFVISAGFTSLQVFVGGVTVGSQQPVPIQANPSRIVHPNYQASPRINDIGIVFLAVDLGFSRLIQPIVLPPIPSPGAAPAGPYLNEQGTALGFGLPDQQDVLQAAFLRVVPAGRCFQQYPSHDPANQFCGEDTRLRSDICSHDISGPFITLHRGVEILTGISSTAFCNLIQASQPSLFTRVSSYRTWIREHTGV